MQRFSNLVPAMLMTALAFVFPLIIRAIYLNPNTNRTEITIGFVWAKYYYSSLLNANASTTLPAILYALNSIDTIMPGRFNFTYLFWFYTLKCTRIWNTEFFYFLFVLEICTLFCFDIIE